jgi:hypothetical protein
MILAEMDELAQIINDYHDLEEDREAGRMNAFTHGVYDKASINEEVLSRARRLRDEASSLPANIRAALEVMFESLGIVSP